MGWHEEYGNMGHNPCREASIIDKTTALGLDPLDMADPASACFLLSDQARDEISHWTERHLSHNVSRERLNEVCQPSG